MKLGEGGLVVFNIIHLIIAGNGIASIFIIGMVSLFVMCALYGFNDYNDAEEDKLNPKKDLQFIHLILSNKVLFFYIILSIQLSTILIFYLFQGWQIALFLVVLYLINYLYTQKLKSIPIVDIVIVCIWGGLYVCLVGDFTWELAANAGLMTGIAHFFQVVTDKDSDFKNNINTSAIFNGFWANSLLLMLCFLLFSTSIFILNWKIALIAFLPFIVYIISKKVIVSWYISRFIFFILWLFMLLQIYEGN
jgi:4-hydroxybenzoate polyprenyltransferase